MAEVDQLAVIALALQAEAAEMCLPPEEGMRHRDQPVLLFSLVKGTRGYIEKVAHQINGSYSAGCYDACAVMIRRLVETVIIEAFEHYRIDHKIKKPNGDFFQLRDLIDAALREPAWNIGRAVKAALPNLKEVGDLSAHSRRHNAHRREIDAAAPDLRKVVQEFLSLAGLK